MKTQRFIQRAYHERPYTDPLLIDFVVGYLETDVRCQRSGYHKERMLHRLKSARLSGGHRQRLRTVLVEAVARRGGREFRHYCRLAPFIANAELMEKIHVLAREGDPAQRSRARLMLARLGETL